MTAITAHVWNSSQTAYKGELVEASNLRWQDVGGDMGSASVFVGRGEPYLTGGGTILVGDVIRFDVDATAGFAWRVEEYDYIHFSGQEEVAEGWDIRGRGTMVAFEEALVYPSGGGGQALTSDTRVWNFASPELSVATWGTAVETEKATVGVNFGLVELFCDPDAYWIWDRAVPGGIPGTSAPAGTCYFRDTFTKASTGLVEVWAAADDSFEVWVNGIQLLKDDGYYRGNVRKTSAFQLGAGTHTIAIRGTNQNAAKAGVLATVVEVSAAGLYGSVIARTDSTWRCLSYPSSPPGFTPGEILRDLIGEAQTRGALTGVAAGFGDAADVAGIAWPVLTEFSAPVGSTLYSVIRSLGETYCDFRMRPTDLTLDAWVRGTAGTVLASVIFENHLSNPDVDNLRSLTHQVTNAGTIAA